MMLTPANLLDGAKIPLLLDMLVIIFKEYFTITLQSFSATVGLTVSKFSKKLPQRTQFK